MAHAALFLAAVTEMSCDSHSSMPASVPVVVEDSTTQTSKPAVSQHQSLRGDLGCAARYLLASIATLCCLFTVTGTKKVPKAYTVAVSPVRPNLAAVGANTGMAFMTFDRMYPLPVAAMPLRNLAEAHVSPALRLPHEPVAASYVAHVGDSVMLVSCTAVQRVRTGRLSMVVCIVEFHTGMR